MSKKIALITGAGKEKSIGAAIARILAKAGYKVIVHYNESSAAAKKLATQIKGFAIKADMGNDAEIRDMFKIIKEKFGRLDALINNAGTVEFDQLTSVTKESFLKNLQINTFAPLLCTQLAVPMMEKGNIVFISSNLADQIQENTLSYSISKAAVHIIVRNISKQLAPDIRVNAVAPWSTKTGKYQTKYSDEDRQWVTDNTPMKRPNEPEDIAEMVAWVISDKARNITAQVFTVDGGYSVTHKC